MKEIENKWEMYFPLFVNALASIGSFFITLKVIPGIKDTFLKANLFGIDMNKKIGKKM